MQGQVQVTPQSNVVVQQGVPQTDHNASAIKQSYPHKQALVLAAIQVTIGILCVIFQAVAIGIDASASHVGSGIWCGILFGITGAIGLVSAKQRTSGWIVGFMVLSIVSSVMTLVLLIAAAVGAGQDNTRYHYFGYYGRYDDDDEREAKVGMNAILICLALAEAIVSIWSSAICCAGVCCGGTSTTGAVIYYNSAGAAVPGQVMVVNQGQPGHVMYTTPTVQTTYVHGAPTVVSYPNQPGVGYPVSGPVAPPPYAAAPQAQYPVSQPGSTNPNPPTNPEYK